MAIADDGREPDQPRDGDPIRRTSRVDRTDETTGGNDPDETERRGSGGRRLIAMVVGVVALIVLTVWLVLWLTASETSDEVVDGGIGAPAPTTLSAVQ